MFLVVPFIFLLSPVFLFFVFVLQLRQEHTRELDELVEQAGTSGGLGAVGAREMVGELNERINILMAENTVMADQARTLVQSAMARYQNQPILLLWVYSTLTE